MIKKFISYQNKENTVLSIADSLNKPYDQITYLNCSNYGLTSLKGVEKLVNLKKLNCSHNILTSLDEIEKLVKLERLSYSGNLLISLNGIEKLVNLEFLNCSYNQLTNLEGIKNLVNLKFLYCYNNQLTSLKGIENLINLNELYCSYNQLTKIDLEGIEDLYNIGIDGMGLFDNLKNLKYLNVQSNNLSKKYIDYLKKKFKNIDLRV